MADLPSSWRVRPRLGPREVPWHRHAQMAKAGAQPLSFVLAAWKPAWLVAVYWLFWGESISVLFEVRGGGGGCVGES